MTQQNLTSWKVVETVLSSTSEAGGSAGPGKQTLLLMRRTAPWWLCLLQISQEGN